MTDTTEDSTVPRFRVSEFEVSCLDESHPSYRAFLVHLVRETADRWSVAHHGQRFDRHGNGAYATLPSNRDEEWRETYTFDFETAAELASAAATQVRINGRTAADVLEALNDSDDDEN